MQNNIFQQGAIMSYTLTWHGHANFQITTPELSILIDPWFEGNPSASLKAADVGNVDLVLVTHDHADHLGQALEICTTTGAALAAQVELAGHLMKQGVPQEQVLNGIGFNIGGTVEYKGIKITMTQAFHSCERGTPVGYIITLDNGFTLYHAGDTGVFSSMALWGRLYPIDLVMLPIGGVFTMDPKQAALACLLLRSKNVVPMHWGSFPVLEQDTGMFGKHLEQDAPGTSLLHMNPGDTVELVKKED
jgi:L-ascorbate metabolism protein UlaG (beta-lactamase superfamily)